MTMDDLKDAIEEALGKFERYERKLDELEGQVEAFDLGKQDLADEISELENEIEFSDFYAGLSHDPRYQELTDHICYILDDPAQHKNCSAELHICTRNGVLARRPARAERL